ncbi:fatty acid/phospholipid synthesis protein PlsX [Allomeiothermus silvanus DSM 9946]|uniref:Phosphate acyltransferase n=1 Tax=Allomeiothermus silvanus (strain ATCC 700542 / DSM 9946 / NBRC 106475 / NCIMB 13440 / VI-R2) TaxID=526227 RepID=D7BDP1_ALLS1|nr:phosphate acyltransferase PlsX [Allomeiothermus silvanus]ADH64861.1 fatty acid/phospholipid synthesis protein PlsX [Allomeiothermus silvanus DSM 9946]
MKPIALDAMGGDYAPQETVAGALLAAKEGIPVVLVGQTPAVKAELQQQGGDLPIVEAPEYIAMEDAATDVRKKRGASINVCMELVKKGEASAVVAMGHTGATLASALFNLGRVQGVERPTLLIEMPSEKGRVYLTDGGANVDCKPHWLVQFAVMATAYAEAQGVKNPSVGLLSIGEEEGKGNALTNETYPLLKTTPGVRFHGNVEGRDIFKGTTDIVVTDGYTGNVVLKLSEGEARTLLKWVREALTSSPLARLGGLLVRGALQGLRAKMDPAEYGAMPLLGVEGPVFIGHGSADARAVRNAIRKAKSVVEAGLVERVRASIAQLTPAES